MREIPYVKTEEAALARELEQRLLALPRASGILFVGVDVDPALKVYDIWVGCDQQMEEEMMCILVEMTLRDEILRGASLRVTARRGVVVRDKIG